MTNPEGYAPQEGRSPANGDPWRAAPPSGATQPQPGSVGPWPGQYPQQQYAPQPPFGVPGQGYGPPYPYPPQAFGAPPPYGYPGYGQYQNRGTNGMAIASMVLGILWLWWVGSILALIFGYVARSQIRQRNESGNGMAVAGIVLGWIGVGLLIVGVIVAAANSS